MIIKPNGGIIKSIYELNLGGSCTLQFLEGGCETSNLLVNFTSQPGQDINHVYRIYVEEQPRKASRRKSSRNQKVVPDAINLYANCISNAAAQLDDDSVDNF